MSTEQIPGTDGLTEVTQEQFYAAIRALPGNVHPAIAHEQYHEVRGYTSHWKLRGGTGRTIGLSCGGTYRMKYRYFLQPYLVPEGTGG